MSLNTSRRTMLTAAALAIGTAALYLPGLDRAPIYLVRDELFSALTVHSVATTGRDPHGAFLPLYFQMDLLKHGSPMWFQPLLIYAMTLAVKVLPFSETAIRVPMAIAGVVNVVLAYFIGRLLFDRERFAIAPAVLLALTPAHFMYSRFAMDFQAPLPFVLGWLLCVLAYIKRGDARLLLAAGLILGIGLYSYVAAAAFMPLYALLTCAVLYLRRAPARGYVLLAIGMLIPASFGAAFLLNHPTMLRDVAVHYQPDGTAETVGATGAIAAVFSPAHIGQALLRYARFWNPRFLFVDGPLRSTPATWLVGVFLVPMAALLVLGVAQLLRRPRDHVAVLLLGGLLTAPLPASFIDQDEAIRRALEVLPFAALIAAVGLESFKDRRSSIGRWIAFASFWSVIVALAIASHDHVPRAQAFVRAATVPLALAGLMMAFEGFALEALVAVDSLAIAFAALCATQLALTFGFASLAQIALAVTASIALMLASAAPSRARRLVVAVLLAVIASELMFEYVTFTAQRIAGVPASAIVLVIRLVSTSLVLAGAVGAAIAVRRFTAGTDRAAVITAALLMAGALQFAYFYIDAAADPWLRAIHVALVAVLLISTASLAISNLPAADRLGDLTAVGVLVIVCLQFAYFYHDYFGGFQARGSGTNEGNVRHALESSIDIAHGRDVPAIYLARVRNEFGGLGKFYAEFYLLKKNRPDLIDRTIEGDTYAGFELDRIMQLPRGSLVIVNPSNHNDDAVERLVGAGEFTRQTLLKTPDGTPMFWILERAGQGATVSAGIAVQSAR